MTQLQILTQFSQLFIDTKQSLDNYNYNLRNEQFEKDPDDTFEQAYHKGETIFDQQQEDIRNLTEIIDQEEEIIKFFTICKENKQVLINKNNKLIDKLIEMKNKDPKVSKEEIINLREFWNERRIETDTERMNRETKEMLEEVRTEKKYVEEMTRNMIEKERQLNELIENAKIVEMKNELNGKINEIENKLNEFQNNQNELNKNNVKKNEFNDLSVAYQTNLSWNEMKQLEEWTSLKCAEVLFDSDKDDWNPHKILNERIINKKQLLFVIEDEENNKFGGYLNETIDKIGYNKYITDSKAFLFSLQSNGRIKGMMKFEIKDSSHAFVLSNDGYSPLFWFGYGEDLKIYRKQYKTDSYCTQSSYEYHGNEKALCGKDKFIPKRFVVIQMK